VEEGVGEKAGAGDCAEKRSVDGFEPVFVGAIFDETFQSGVTLLDQLAAGGDVGALTGVGLADGGVFHVGGRAEELAEEIHGFSDVAVDEADGRGFGVEAERSVSFCDAIQREVICELVLFEDFE